MPEKSALRAEFGDFQTPIELAREVCAKLLQMGLSPARVIEPTCGLGAFVLAAAEHFPAASIFGHEINNDYLSDLRLRIDERPGSDRVSLRQADFFQTAWAREIQSASGLTLILGNLPWVTNSTLGVLGSDNLPEKCSQFGHSGFEAISGKANFDISEWMLLELMKAGARTRSAIAMLVKTTVARKVLSHAERQQWPVNEACLYRIDAKKHFAASVDACLLVLQLDPAHPPTHHDYTVFESIHAPQGQRIGHRDGLTVSDLDAFEGARFLLGTPPEKWRSGVKHDAAPVMEITRTTRGLVNGLDEEVDIEPDLLFPLLKGSDIGSGRVWRNKYLLVTQRSVGEGTEWIRLRLPKTWRYLERHAAVLDRRASTIYAKAPRFSVFGVGDYAFRPWRVAICGLYKALNFRLVEPIDERPVQFDDTVYYLSFESPDEAAKALEALSAEPARRLLESLIFWDEKRPVKTAVLNRLDWTALAADPNTKPQVELDFT